MAEKLTPQQQEAVENRGGKLLVSAAAGSGKTKVLVDRLLSYIIDPSAPANVDDFLIITYTKAAASELRGKISEKLSERIAEDPENIHLQRQIQRLYLAKISTVHAFCGDILREYAYQLDLSADFRVADEIECSEIQREVLEQVLEDAYETAADNPDFCAFLDTQGLGRDDRSVPEILLRVYSGARCHLDPFGWLSRCVADCSPEGITDPSQTVWGRYLIEDLHRHLDLELSAVRRCAELAEENGTMPKPAALLSSIAEQLQALRDCDTWDKVVSFPEIQYGRLTFPKNCTDGELAERIKAVRTACKKEVEKKLRSFADPADRVLQDLQQAAPAARGLFVLIKQFDLQYARAKQARRVLDFGDLEHKALDLLLGKNRTAPTAAAREIGSRFREIMVDEYQDSNQVQDAIFGALTGKRQNCFMVGDVKQSIYQFRLADPGIFIEKYNTYVPAAQARPGQGRKVILSRNFRSSQGVISGVNDVFTACMSPEVGGLVYGEDERLYEGIPHIPLPEPETELCCLAVSEDTYAEEASYVADRIAELLDGTHMVRQGDVLRPIEKDDIVILLRSPGSVGAEFRFALEGRGIACTTGDSMDLFRLPEISTLRDFLEIIGNPLQDIPLLAVLTSPVFEFTADDLAVLRSGDRKSCIFDLLSHSGSPKAVRFLEILNGLRRDAGLYTVSRLLEKIFVVTGWHSVYAAMEDGETKSENLQAFCQLASDYESGGRKTLGYFLEYLTSLEEKGLKVPTEKSGDGAVTIMSIHKSKGLEFPVVFLSGLSRSFNQESLRDPVLFHKELGLGLSCADQTRRVRYPSMAKKAISLRLQEEGISEEMRVLYVAMTRARDRLIMTYADKYLETHLKDLALRMDLSDRRLLTESAGCPGTWVLLTALTHTEAGALFQLGGKPACSCVSPIPWKISLVEPSPAGECLPEPEAPKARVTEQQITTMAASLAYQYPHMEAVRTPSKQTATQLKGRDKDQEAAEYCRIAYDKIFREPSFGTGETGGKQYGNAVHGFMQYVKYENCGSPEAVREEIRRLTELNLISSQQGEMIDPNEIAAFFRTDLGKKLASSPDVIREFKFSILTDAEKFNPDVHGEQVLFQGVVDCALIEEDGITVLDFKTDRVTEETVESRIQAYRSQVLSYADALERIYEKKIKKTLLYFFRLGKFAEIKRS